LECAVFSVTPARACYGDIGASEICCSGIMTLHEFLKKAGLADRTLRLYHRQGLVPQADGDGHYGELHLLRVSALPLLRAKGIRGPEKLADALNEMTVDDLRRFVEEEFDSDESMSAAGVSVDSSGAPVAVFDRNVAPMVAAVSENHVHIPLREGIVLDVRMPLDDEGQALVKSIASLCGMNASFF